MARNFCGRNSMKNRSIAQIILINFFKTIGVIVLLLGVGTQLLSYNAVFETDAASGEKYAVRACD